MDVSFLLENTGRTDSERVPICHQCCNFSQRSMELSAQSLAITNRQKCDVKGVLSGPLKEVGANPSTPAFHRLGDFGQVI